MKVRNTFIIFLVSGFWHGANWTFIVWGGLNALYFLPLLLLKRNRTNLGVVAEGRMLPNLRELWQMGTTFLFTVLAWVFFRAENISHATSFLQKVFSITIIKSPYYPGIGLTTYTLIFILILVIVEWINRGKSHSLMTLPKNKIVRYTLYYILVSSIILNSGSEQQFIYFQF